MNSIQMRMNSLFMRNNFKTHGFLEFPIIKKQSLPSNIINLISYSDTRLFDTDEKKRCGVHFFIDDYRFNGIYNNPERTLNKLSQYLFLLTPDYSTYSDMNIWRQIESVAHSRWVGAYWQDYGFTVYPTVTWSDKRSFDFCFNGIEQKSTVAIGMIGCKRDYKKEFLYGYDAMLEHISPENIICYGPPFQEMKGNLIVVNYSDSRKKVKQ